MNNFLFKKISIAPLVIFRIAFGSLMFISILRFILKGWVHSMYIMPKMFFPYFGFEWVKPLPAEGMYVVFGLMLFCSLAILLGFLYRFSATLFFLLFTYVELIDKTNYLNHYYFISLIAFLMIFIPAGRAFSLDNKLFKRSELKEVSNLFLLLLQLQMFVVYFFAGVAKLNYDWLIEAMPLKIWLPAYSHYPVIGQFMEQEWVAYLFSWFGCIYDLVIGFMLFNRRTVRFAYVLVIVFHVFTAMFFNIGMFPYIMMTITIVFFSQEFHMGILEKLRALFRYSERGEADWVKPQNALKYAFVVYFIFQFAMPFRYLFYKGDLFWTEQGYRFSWRVMLMEKAGTAFFFVKERNSDREIEVDNKEHLTYLQEKMMATQPDMMVDYAKYLKEYYKQKGFVDPEIRAQGYVTLNGSGSREFVDKSIDLSSQSNSFLNNKNWIKTN